MDLSGWTLHRKATRKRRTDDRSVRSYCGCGWRGLKLSRLVWAPRRFSSCKYGRLVRCRCGRGRFYRHDQMEMGHHPGRPWSGPLRFVIQNADLAECIDLGSLDNSLTDPTAFSLVQPHWVLLK